MKNLFLPALLSVILVSCSQLPTDHNSGHPSYSYIFSLPALHPDSLSISLVASQSGRFVLPFHFFDNPLDSFSAEIVRDLQVFDCDGAPADTLLMLEKIGPIYNQVIGFSSDVKFPVTIRWRINPEAFSDTTLNLLPPVALSTSRLSITGASCFIIPFIEGSIAQMWRKSLDLEIDFKTGVKVYGIPKESFRCSNLYELLFLQIFSGDPVIAQGTGGGTDFTFLNLREESYEPGVMQTVSRNFSLILDEIAAAYGSFPENYTVAFQVIGGGLEATYGFSLLRPSLDTNYQFHEVLAHEALHNFIGIRCGEYDDPWWKEATTNYLGAVLATRLNLYNKGSLRGRLTARFAYTDSSRFNLALSDQWLRENMFPQGVYPLVYNKGSQVVMLLDLRVRQASGNKYSINDVTVYLTKKFNKSAFNRQDFLAAFRSFGNTNVDDIFSDYIDLAGAKIPDSLLSFTFDSLDSLGAFGD